VKARARSRARGRPDPRADDPRAPRTAAPVARASSTGPAGAWTLESGQALVDIPRTHPNDRVAFVLHFAELINHFRNIWRHLDPASFDIVCASAVAEDNERIAAFAAANGYAARFIGDAYERGDLYAATVTNHPFAPAEWRGAPTLELGRRNVRLMYGLGKDGWNYSPWNELYDLILCWGPHQAAKLAAFARPLVVQVGYPRFDHFFSPGLPRADAARRLGCDPSRPTVAWLPTWSHLSSIDRYAEAIGQLRSIANVVCKVHPFTTTREPERMALLAAAGITPVADTALDNVLLFQAADLVLADYGGSAFGAICTGRPLLLLNVPGATDDPTAGPESLDVQLRRWVPSVDTDGVEAIRECVLDPSILDANRGNREELRRMLFAPHDGFAGEVAALVLRHLEVLDRTSGSPGA
jgi:hypothetical protein